MKYIKAQIDELRALIPKQPEFMISHWYEGEPKPKGPKGYKGVFVIIRCFTTAEEVAAVRARNPNLLPGDQSNSPRPACLPIENEPIIPRKRSIE